jgi:hypothetical protein
MRHEHAHAAGPRGHRPRRRPSPAEGVSKPGRGPGDRGSRRARDRVGALFLPVLLLAGIVTVLVPAVVVDEGGVVLLKLVAAALLSFLPG